MVVNENTSQETIKQDIKFSLLFLILIAFFLLLNSMKDYDRPGIIPSSTPQPFVSILATPSPTPRPILNPSALRFEQLWGRSDLDTYHAYEKKAHDFLNKAWIGGIGSSGSPYFFWKDKWSKDLEISIRACRIIEDPYTALPDRTILATLPITIDNVTLANNTPAISLTIEGQKSVYFMTDTPIDYLQYFAVCLWNELERRKPPTLVLENGTEVPLWAVPPISDVTDMSQEDMEIFRERMEEIVDVIELRKLEDELHVYRPITARDRQFLNENILFWDTLDRRRIALFKVGFTDKGIFLHNRRGNKSIDDISDREDYLRFLMHLDGILIYRTDNTWTIIASTNNSIDTIFELPFIAGISPYNLSRPCIDGSCMNTADYSWPSEEEYRDKLELQKKWDTFWWDALELEKKGT